jgi:hypothetical protein
MLAALGAAMGAAAQSPPTKPLAPKSLAEATTGLQRLPGLLPVYLDTKGGRVLLALTPDAKGECGAYLYQLYMRSGLGSTPIGIDRNNPGATNIIAFRRVGPKVIAELQNYAFRADAGGPDERAAVRESFAPSIVWSGEVAAEGDGQILVDISTFLTRDAFGVVDDIKRAGQGDYHLALDRSYVDVEDVQVFPENLEFEAHQTYASDKPGSELRGLVPEPHALTLIQHQSLVKLPEPGFVPRRADPRTGTFGHLVVDYGAPLNVATAYRLAARFRLEKTDPSAARSPVKKPIVFYVDRAAPEPIRSALLEGARWWAQAFDAAGFIDAFKVEVLPEGVSPLDARYNVINWVHRQTRGWSYGFGVTDPRTGEIVKGSVLLGSLRARQDEMIFQSLVGADKTGTGSQDDPIVVSLARLRQLAVHETGHALGLAHNFAGSTYGDRASVMDYPPPRIRIDGDRLDFSQAYKVGIGDWDRFAIKWLYSPVPPGRDGEAALEAMVRHGYGQGLRYVRDEDARPTGSAHPNGGLWDDGPDAVASLAEVMKVRQLALSHFGPANIPAGAPLSDLRRVIVPIYLFHRYEVDSVSKSVGGVDFTYAVRGDGLNAPVRVDGKRQRAALGALLATLDPAALDLPDPLIAQLSNGLDGQTDRAYQIEQFGKPHTPVFDLGEAADAAADITLGDLLEPSRLERVAEQGALERTLDHVFAGPEESGRRAMLRRRVQLRTVVQLAAVLEDKATPEGVSAQVRAALDRLGRGLAARTKGEPTDLAQARYLSELLLSRMHDGLAALAEADRKRDMEPPPGMPIGDGDGEDCWLCEVLSFGR